MTWLLLALGAPASAAPPGRAKVEALAQRRQGSLEIGDRAPDPGVVTLDGAPVQLLAARGEGRPLVVVFGSFT